MANINIPASLDGIKNSFQAIRGNVPNAYEGENAYKYLKNSIINNSRNISKKNKISVAKGKLVGVLSRFNKILNDSPLSKIPGY